MGADDENRSEAPQATPMRRREVVAGIGAGTVLTAGLVAVAAKHLLDDDASLRANEAAGPSSTSSTAGLDAATTTGVPADAGGLVAGEGPAATRRGGGGGGALSPGRPPPRPLTEAERRTHVVRRLTFGHTPQLLAEVDALGADGFVAQQLDPGSIDESAADGMAGWPGGPGELRHATVVRAVYGRRQLYELMVDFWTNHFNVCIEKDAGLFTEVPVYDRTTIRPHAMGRFADLLQATAKSPAMLRYLENFSSRGEDPNENYGRELLELHTVGPGGNYTEDDVRNVALTLSGWTISGGRFAFDWSMHYGGPVAVLGWSSPGGDGLSAGEQLLDHLAHHPATARHLATKLVRRFVADDPPAGLVDSAADVYLAHDTAIVPVLAHIFASEDFWQSIGQKLRRPFELMVAMLRASSAAVPASPRSYGATVLNAVLLWLGQRLFGCEQPNGYPDVGPAWATSGSMVQRWLQGLGLVFESNSGCPIDLEAIAGPASLTAGQAVDNIVARILAVPVPDVRRQALISMVGGDPNAPVAPYHPWILRKVIGVAFSAAEFQYR